MKPFVENLLNLISLKRKLSEEYLVILFRPIHRIHRWRTPSHESEALLNKQKLQTKTFSELAECSAWIPPKITLYGRLFYIIKWDVFSLGRWLQKSGTHVGPSFTLKPSTKASALQFYKTEIRTDLGGKKNRNKRRIYGILVNARNFRH